MFTDRKLKEYNEREERFRLAVEEATLNKSASINSIANKYRVSRTTLSRRIHGFKNTRNSHEKQQKFTNEEEHLIVDQIQEILKSSDQVPPKREILIICERVLKDKYKHRAPAEGENFFKVGKNWIDRFLERHNDKLMINQDTTLSEYYKSEFLQRKKLRSDRSFKNDSSTSLTEDSFQQQPPLQSYSSAESTHQLDPQAPPPRLPYQSHSDPFIYQNVEQPVPLNPYSGYPLNQHPSYGQEWQYGNLQHKQQGAAPSFQQLQTIPQPLQQQQQQQQHQQQYTYGNIPAPGSLQYQLPQQQPQVQPPQQPQPQTQPQQPQQPQAHPQQQKDSKASYAQTYMYGNQHTASKPAITPVLPAYDPSQPSSHQQQPSQPQHSHQAQGSQQFNNFQFNQHYPTSANENTEMQLQENEASQTVQPTSPDSLQFYHGQRFQYEAVRQRIVKELERENVDVHNVIKLVNLSFNQIERDLGVNYNNIHSY